MRLCVDHTTTYRFDPPVRGLTQSFRMTPSQTEGQQTIDWAIEVEGAVRGSGFRDGAGDWIETSTLLGTIDEVSVHVTGTVETLDTGGVLKGNREKVPPLAYLRDTRSTRIDRSLCALAESAVQGIDAQDQLARAHALSHAVGKAIVYRAGKTLPETTASEALSIGFGVCQDHAHALIAAARSLELPARYVTGYLFASEEDEVHEASHAWAEIFVRDLGWVGFDPSNTSCPDERYIRLGSGLDAADAAPIRGVSVGPGEEDLSVRVKVNQVSAQDAQ